MARQRIEWLDALRGMAMVFVVMGHAMNMPAFARTLIYSFHMPLFFAISGAVFRVGKYRRLRECVADKARTLLLPYLLLYLLNIPLWAISSGVLRDAWATPADLALGLVSGCVLGAYSNQSLWFLPALFFVSVLFWCLAQLQEKLHVPLWLSMAALFCAGLAVNMLLPGGGILHWRTVPMATVFYYLGHVFLQKRTTVFKVLGYTPAAGAEEGAAPGKPSFKPWFAPLAIALLALGMASAAFNGKISMMSNIYQNPAITMLSACSTCTGLAMVTMALPKVKPLDYAGQNTLAFFGWHPQLLNILALCPVTGAVFGPNPWLAVAVVWVALYPLSAATAKLCPAMVGKRRAPKAPAGNP